MCSWAGGHQIILDARRKNIWWLSPTYTSRERPQAVSCVGSAVVWKRNVSEKFKMQFAYDLGVLHCFVATEGRGVDSKSCVR